MTDRLKMHSLNKIDENVEKISRLFPNCVTEAKDENGGITHKIDFDMLKQELSDSIVCGSEERYQFTWPDKRQAILTANAPINKTLRPCREESVDFDNTENLYIEGDNLEVLKLLQETYLGKIKMIYIDPPYNTGNDFVYNDDFSQEADEYLEGSGQFDEQGNRLFQNTESNGRFHTDWLNMIYPRLKLAKDLLSDDGVIFISIADEEIDNLKKICDEIFGECNFKTVFSRVTKKGGKSSSEVAKNHDFLLMYVKNTELADLKGIAHTDEGYCKKDKFFEQRGYYKANQTLDYDSLGYVKSLDYPIEIDGEVFYAGGTKKDYENRQRGQHGRADWGWRWSKELFAFGLKNGFIEVHKGGERNRIYTKTYEKVTIDKSGDEYKIVEFDRTKPLSTLEFTENEYSNDNAKKVFDSIMGKGIFEYTKTPEMIKTLQNLVATKDFIILDFFSGSATTAHAVMQLNAEDGGNRKFIMVQLPEPCDEKSEAYKAGYKNICEIGKERIRRAGKKISEQWSVDSKQKKGGKNGCSKLQGIADMAEGNADCEGDLCSIRPNEAGRSVDSVKHSGRTVKEFNEGVHSLPVNSERLEGGTGNTASSLQGNRLSDGRGDTTGNELVARGKQNALYDENETDNSQLTTDNCPLDIGFRVLKCDSSNMKDVYYNPDEYEPSLFSKLVDNIKEGRTPEDLLFQVMLDLGVLLSSKIEETIIAGKKVFKVEDNYLIACFDENITDDVITEIAKRKPYYFVMRDSSMATDSVATNFEQIFAAYSPETVKKVI